jgi:hypothetical protein
MVESEGTMDQWYFKVKRDYAMFARAYVPREEAPSVFQQEGQTLVARMQTGVLRPHTIIRIDYHVSANDLPFSQEVGTFTVWFVFEDVVKAAGMWLALRSGGALLLLHNTKSRSVAALGLFKPRLVTSTLIHSGKFHYASNARWDDIAKVKALGLPVAPAPMDDYTRWRLWVFNHTPPVDPETQAATVAKLARAADTLERESADPDDREYWQLFREALERDNNPRCNA